MNAELDWTKLRAASSAAHVPNSIARLAKARTEAEADESYWQIDNVVMVQGALYEAAEPTSSLLVDSLTQCTEVGLTRILEAIEQIAQGSPADSEIQVGNESLLERCQRRIIAGIPSYLTILETGTAVQVEMCLSILGCCVELIARDRERVYEAMKKVAFSEGSAPRGRKLAENWLDATELWLGVTPHAQ